MFTPALVAAILAAVIVQLRHRELTLATELDPTAARAKHRQLIFETWLLTAPALALLLSSCTRPGRW